MTKKQNRIRGFGKRSLSVLLSVLMILSMLVVMLTVTSLPASAAISYWNVAGDFNNWQNSLNNTAYRINGGSGSVTINISSNQYSSIKFKMCAYEDGWKWCGVGASSSDQDAYQSINANEEVQTTWNGGVNMSVNLPSNTTQVRFDLIVKDGKNYVKVVPNGDGGGGDGPDASQMTYTAPVNANNAANKANNLFWANATYFDYESDTELSNGWLKPLQAGTHNFNGAQDEWYPFYIFNRSVVKAQADAQSSWSTPLYFGNFCDTNNAYDSPHHQNGTDSYGYREATNSNNVTRFVHIANNSDYNQAGSAHLANMYCSYQGLVNSSLSSSGDLLLPNGQQAPYFNASESGPLKGYAKVVNSSFPFKVTTYADKKYKKYTFNSKNAQDNVYFTWASNGSATYPTGVNYGEGTAYGVLDGVSRFMYNGTSGYGIFPFNNASGNYKGTKTNANENLNYGFGIKTQVKFRVPKPSADVNTASDPIYFRFSGDDDLWMYITDEKGNSQLVLDMGGDHKESTGKVNFHNLTSTVDKVGTSGNSVTKSFSFDYNQTYTMTVFYMERGLIESNCEMEFTMTPLGNNFIVTEEIDTVNVNEGLQDVVKQLSEFGFVPYNNNSELPSDSDYNDFELGDGEEIQIPDTDLEINSNVKVQQYAPKNSYLVYDTTWKYYDNTSNPRKLLGEGTGVTSNGVTTITSEETIINESGNEYDFAELQVDYRNTPQIGSFSVKKEIDDSSDYDYSGETFPVTIYLKFASDENFKPYTLKTSDGKTARNGRYTLHRDETVTFEGVPVGTHVCVVEDSNSDYSVSYSHNAKNPYIVPASGSTGGPSITVTNTPVNPDAIYGEVEGTKQFDGSDYTGRLFRFNLEGVAPMPDDPADAIDTSDVSLYTDDVADGQFTINGLIFDKPGLYRYHVYEDPDNLAIIDEQNGDTTYASDIYNFGTDYLVVFNITRNGSALEKDGPYYIPYSPYEDMVGADDPTGAPVEHTMVPSDFDLDGASEDPMEFFNYAHEGSVHIIKTDRSDTLLDGVTFGVYAVDDDFIESMEGKSDEEKYDMVKALNPVGTATTGDADYGFETGEAKIENLCIYIDGYSESSHPNYQQYCMIELSGPENYNINKTMQIFTFPTPDENGIPQYDYTFEYVNGMLRTPTTAGSGMTLFKILGAALAMFSVLALGGYMLYTKGYVKRKTVKEIKK